MSIILPKPYHEKKAIQTLIENRTSYTVNCAELNIFETGTKVSNVNLEFSDPVIASMIKGRKIMRVKDYDVFNFLPGESLIMPAEEIMNIEFPDATEDMPTQCTALTIEKSKFYSVIDRLNENRYKDQLNEIKYDFTNFHFSNSLALQQIINRLMFLFAEEHPEKDFFVDLMLQELIIRLLQTRSLQSLSVLTNSNKNPQLSTAIDYIKNNLSQHIEIDHLSHKACMSNSHFYRCFKTEFGISPTEYINKARIDLAVSLMRDHPMKQLKEIYFECGFNNYSHFTSMFKRYKQMTPQQYRQRKPHDTA